VVNTVSGAQEFRLATFVIQAMVTAVIFAVLLFIALTTKHRRKDGDLTLLFLLLYGASQVVLDSTRYDSLFFRSNGFVSIVQVLCALALGLSCAVFSVRLVKRHGFQRRYAALWLEFGALVGLGGYMEYYVQRHGDQAVFAYCCMSGALIGIVAIVVGIWYMANREPTLSLLSATEQPEAEMTPEEAITPSPEEEKSPEEAITPAPEEEKTPEEAITPSPEEEKTPEEEIIPASEAEKESPEGEKEA